MIPFLALQPFKVFTFVTFRTPTRRQPTINGKELDLYLLYQLVTSKGGWVKVRLFDSIDCVNIVTEVRAL